MIKLYGTLSSRAFRVKWMLEELGLPYDFVETKPGSAEARAVNPSGKVPVLEVDGQRITDSTAILIYLADREGRMIAPAGSMERAQQDSLTQFLLDEMDACIWTAARHSFVLPEERRLPAIKDSLKWEFGRAEARLAARLKGPFLMGDEMTVPDIIAVHCLIWAAVAKFPLTDPALAEYGARLQSRPAFQRTMGR